MNVHSHTIKLFLTKTYVQSSLNDWFETKPLALNVTFTFCLFQGERGRSVSSCLLLFRLWTKHVVNQQWRCRETKVLCFVKI